VAQGFGNPQGPWQQGPWQQGQWQQGQWQQGPWQQPSWPPAAGQQPMQPAWGGAGGQFPAPQPPRRRGLGPVILAGLGVLGVIMLGLVAYSVFSGPDYQNEDYVPPPPGNVKPFPDAPVSEVENLVTRNSLYAQTVPRPVSCVLSNPDMDIDAASNAEVKAYIDELMACNMRVWDPPFQATGEYELVRPAVNVYGESVTTPCGGGEAMGPNAVYCSANQEVYWSRAITGFLPLLSEPHAVDMVMAHEFGHGIQARTLILQANAYSQRQVDRSEALEMNRRIELQADCFAGLWVQSVAESMDYSQAEIRNMIAAIEQTGDEPGTEGDHGQAASRGYWIQIGMSRADVGGCNTHIADGDVVR
jgi:predicted metalloprotease